MSSLITQTPPFTPLSLSNCSLWLDASDPTTCLKSGSTVTAWNDKSGNGKNITITGTLTFSNATGNVGAANSVNTSASLNSYFTTSVDLRKSVTPNASVFIIYAWLAAGGGATAQTFWGNDNPNAANRVQFFDFSSVFNNNSYGYFLNNGYLYNPTQLNRSTTQMYELISQVGVTNGTGVYFNGTLGPAGFGTEVVNTSFSGNEILYFGGGETSSIYPSYTQFNEILVYSNALTQGQRQQIEGYLSWKWNLVGLLPSGHPFKYFPPNSTPNFAPVRFTNSIFQPPQISGCQLWLDAADPNVFTLSGSNVLQWNDKSGNRRNAIPRDITKTPIRYLGFNGRFTVESSSESIFGTPLLVNIASSNVQGTTGLSLFWVFKFISGVVITQYEWTGLRMISFEGNNRFDYGEPNSVYTPSGYNNTNNSLVNLNVDRNTNLLDFRFQGTTLASYSVSPPTTAFTTTIGLFGRGGDASNVPAQAQISEYILYNTTLTVSQRQEVEGYLAWKWGLTSSLPNGHPYKTPPFLPFSYGVRTTVQRKWLPTQISGLTLWTDASDPATITLSGTAVTQWNDKSGNGNNLSAEGIYSNAVVASNYQNKLNVLNFSGSNVYRSPLNSAPYPADSFFVISLKTGATRNDIFSVAAAAADDFTGITTGAYSTNYEWNQASSLGSRSYNTGFVETVGPFLLMNWTLANNNMVLRRNTVSIGGSTAYTWTKPTNAVYYLGIRISPNVYWGGVPDVPFNAYVAEIVSYSSALSLENRQQVEGYLAWKWGLQASLPITHPFKYFPPSPP